MSQNARCRRGEETPAAASPGARGQSRTISLLLLTVVAIGLTAGVAALSFTVIPGDDDEMSVAGLDVTATEERVTVIHTGGDTLDASDLRVEINGGETSVSLASFSSRSGDSERFSAGERWNYDVELGDGPVRLVVVHEPTGTVLVETRETL